MISLDQKMELPGSRTSFDLRKNDDSINFHLIEIGCKRNGKVKQLWQRREILEDYWLHAVYGTGAADFFPGMYRSIVHFLPSPNLEIDSDSQMVDNVFYVAQVQEGDLLNLSEKQRDKLYRSGRTFFSQHTLRDLLKEGNPRVAHGILRNTDRGEFGHFRGQLAEYLGLNLISQYLSEDDKFIRNGWLKDITCALSQRVADQQNYEFDGIHVFYDKKSYDETVESISSRPEVALYKPVLRTI